MAGKTKALPFTKADRQRVLDILLADSQAQCVYKNDEGETCAIGGLMVAANIPLPSPVRKPTSKRAKADEVVDLTQNETALTYLPTWMRRLQEEYHLTEEQLDDIQKVNDNEDYVDTRHDKLEAMVSNFPTVD